MQTSKKVLSKLWHACVGKEQDKLDYKTNPIPGDSVLDLLP
jgi:hypothetical protein